MKNIKIIGISRTRVLSIRNLLLLVLLVMLSGCGGGGGSSGGKGGGTPNNAAVDKINPATFDLVAVSTIEPTTLTVDWKPTTDNVTAQKAIKYIVNLSTTDRFIPSNTTANTSIIGKTTAVAAGLSVGTTYYVRVIARDKAGNESWSNQLKAKTAATAPVATAVSVTVPKNARSITPSSITYSASTAPAAGTILVSQQGQSYLRKVTSATEKGGVVSAQLAPASLNELFRDISINSHIRLVSTNVATNTSSATKLLTSTGIRALRIITTTRQLKWSRGLKQG